MIKSTTPTQNQHEAFKYLYPDIDPTIPAKTTPQQRIALCLAVTILTFGATTGNLAILATGLTLIVFALTVVSTNPAWRVRREAQSRFPHEPWTTTSAIRLIPVLWSLMGTASLATLYLAPNIWTGGVIAALSGIATWFMPGLSSIWRR